MLALIKQDNTVKNTKFIQSKILKTFQKKHLKNNKYNNQVDNNQLDKNKDLILMNKSLYYLLLHTVKNLPIENLRLIILLIVKNYKSNKQLMPIVDLVHLIQQLRNLKLQHHMINVCFQMQHLNNNLYN